MLLSRRFLIHARRTISTLSNNKHIYVFPKGSSHALSLIPSDTPHLVIGTTTTLPPTPDTFTENPRFLEILQSVLREHAHEDPDVLSQAQAFVTTAGSALGPGGILSPQRKRRGGGDGAGGASGQGGAGGGGRGGWVHLSDTRAPPDYGRIAWPEDIFGSLEVNSQGDLVGPTGGYQPSGTYRIITREGILGLSDFLRGKVIKRLQADDSLQI